MAENSERKNIRIGLWSAAVSSGYLIIADYLLKHFSAPWLLFTSLLILPLSIPTLRKNKHKYKSWSQSAWTAFLVVGILSAAHNLTLLLSAEKLPISVASMFLSISSVMVLPLSCTMQKRLPKPLELAAIGVVPIGVCLVLKLHKAEYSLAGIALGLLTSFLTANATIYSGKTRNILTASEAMIAKTLGKLTFALIGLTLSINGDLTPKDSNLFLWMLLGLYGLMKIYDSFVASRAQFLLPPLVFQNLSLLSLPLVCIGEVILFKGTLTIWQWAGVVTIVIAGFLATLSKQQRLQAIV